MLAFTRRPQLFFVLVAVLVLSSALAFMQSPSGSGQQAPPLRRQFLSEDELQNQPQTQHSELLSARSEGSSSAPLAFGVALGLAVAVLTAKVPVALAADEKHGAEVFAANCAACHAGGNNAVQPDKKLKKEALTQYGMYDVERIKYQVTNGKNAMPAFGERLAADDIEDVATYVISQADAGWTS
eukprot:TRINITY_DN112231_c0_g1_i1.p1 TRINITY_DN112231_c0_g1~~TRINITY_DN112231_c0_g1_i1.p1  ORF type:complete len:184 (-),score=43.62 TRINITY_DN112231_c0_g1_i1:10-561(-)